METTTRLKSQDERYELSKCVDTNHDYDGGTWYHIWDNTDEVILYENNNFHETCMYLYSLTFDQEVIYSGKRFSSEYVEFMLILEMLDELKQDLDAPASK